MIYFFVALVCILLVAAVFWLGLRQRDMDIWFWPAVLGRGSEPVPEQGLVDVMFCFVDHYEPLFGKVSDDEGTRRVHQWLDEYPKIADRYRDSDGVPPQHSYFYPQDEYRERHLELIADLCAQGYGEIEIHIHHGGEGEQGFREKMQGFIHILHDKGLLPELDGQPKFGFIHGNWALDNSRCDGEWCGLNNELIILDDLGCYADFTLPSAPSDTQTTTINSIYYAKDDPQGPKSHDTGVPVAVGGSVSGDLLLIQGPLGLNWRKRALGIWPRIENGDFTPTPFDLEERVDDWVRLSPAVAGRPEWRFVKIHTHGANPINSSFLFEQGAFERLCRVLDDRYNDGSRYRLHYVTAREMYNIVKAAEAGKTGNPGNYRDFLLQPPRALRRSL